MSRSSENQRQDAVPETNRSAQDLKSRLSIFLRAEKLFVTPAAIWDLDALDTNIGSCVRAMKKATDKIRVYYAIKACHIPLVLKQVAAAGLGAEVLSMFEYQVARKMGFDGGSIVWNGPGKTEKELVVVLRQGVECVNADSLTDLKRILRAVENTGKPTRIGLRIQPRLSETTNHFVAKSRFGFEIGSEDLLLAARELRDHPLASIHQIHCHQMRACDSPDAFEVLLDGCLETSKRVSEILGQAVPTISLGGGIAGVSRLRAAGLTLEEFLETTWEKAADRVGPRSLVFELGRAMVSDACVVFSRILDVKHLQGRKWYILDATTNFLVPLDSREYEVFPLTSNGRDQVGIASYGDRLGYAAGVIKEDAPDFGLSVGDYVLIENCGAYTFTLRSDFGFPHLDVYTYREGSLERVFSFTEEDAMAKLLRFSV